MRDSQLDRWAALHAPRMTNDECWSLEPDQSNAFGTEEKLDAIRRFVSATWKELSEAQRMGLWMAENGTVNDFPKASTGKALDRKKLTICAGVVTTPYGRAALFVGQKLGWMPLGRISDRRRLRQ